MLNGRGMEMKRGTRKTAELRGNKKRREGRSGEGGICEAMQLSKTV